VSSEGFLPRFFLGLAASLCAVVFAVGCAVDERGAALGAGQERGSWANKAELAWLKRLGAWDSQLIGSLRMATQSGEAPARAQTCTRDLVTQVGPAPSTRLASAQRAFLRACSELEQGDAEEASRLLIAADQLLPPGELRALPVIAGQSGASRVEPRFGLIASALAREDVEVRCWSEQDWDPLMREERTYTRGQLGSDTLGFAGIHGRRVSLAPDVCAALVRLAYEGARPHDEASMLLLAAAVVTLSHEPQHSKGIVNEAVAECNAIQHAHRTAMKLGVERAYANALVRTYWQHYDEELPHYRSNECRDAGGLDLGLADSIWR
jgi:hypothetical protein